MASEPGCGPGTPRREHAPGGPSSPRPPSAPEAPSGRRAFRIAPWVVIALVCIGAAVGRFNMAAQRSYDTSSIRTPPAIPSVFRDVRSLLEEPTEPRPPSRWSAPPPARSVERQVALELRVKRWNEAINAFPARDEIVSALKRAGVEAGPPGEAGRGRATVRVTWEEARGERASLAGFQLEGAPYGTVLRVEAVCVSPAGEVLGTLRLEAAAPANRPHAEVHELRSDPAWAFLGTFVAAACGVAEARKHVVALCAHPDAGPAVRRMLIDTGHAPEPGDPVDAACFAIAARHINECVALGPSAVVPLLRFLELSPDTKSVIATARALGEIGDERASDHLVHALGWRASIRRRIDGITFIEGAAPRQVAILRALGRVGDASALPAVTRLKQRGDLRVQGVAAETEKDILERTRR